MRLLTTAEAEQIIEVAGEVSRAWAALSTRQRRRITKRYSNLANAVDSLDDAVFKRSDSRGFAFYRPQPTLGPLLQGILGGYGQQRTGGYDPYDPNRQQFP